MTVYRHVEHPFHLSPERQVTSYMLRELGGRQCVYFIEFNRWVKIGYSSSITARFQQLDCLPEPVTILAVLYGDRTLEKQLHNRFKQYHSYAEWFVNEGKLAEYIEQLRTVAREKVAAEPKIRRRA